MPKAKAAVPSCIGEDEIRLAKQYPSTRALLSLCLTIGFYHFESQNLQYYLEKNLDARERELEREAELDEKAPKVKAKSKMSKWKKGTIIEEEGQRREDVLFTHIFARKGPLSTVWIAAHLQHRLKKSHYTSTDIPSTVQHIMDPGVPIALRMSGHLLLGVVRIYSKKVDYLFHDCNVVLTVLSKAFASIQLTLPEGARQAPVQSITLPNTFDLDALNLDDAIDHNGVEDIHQRSLEDITLTDQVPVMDQYVAISFDEVQPYLLLTCIWTWHWIHLTLKCCQIQGSDQWKRNQGQGILRESPTSQPSGGVHPHNIHSPGATVVLGPSDDSAPHTEVLPDSGVKPMEEDTILHSPLTNALRESPTAQLTGGDHDHNLQSPVATVVFSPGDDSVPQATMPVEVRRDANNDCNLENPPINLDLKDGTEPSRDVDQTTNEKNYIEMVDDMATEGMPSSSQQHSGPPTPVHSQGAALDAQVGVGHSAPNLILRESPPDLQQQRRGRKRKQFFDEPIVLTNKFMRAALNNTRDLLRKRRDVPSSTLGTWKLNNSRRKEHIFDQPLLTGFCRDLLDISNKEYICLKPHLVTSEEDHVDAGIDRSSPTNQIHEEPRATGSHLVIYEEGHVDAGDDRTPPANQTREEPRAATPPDSAPAMNMEIEHLRNINATPPLTTPAHDVGIELNIEGDYRSPVRDDWTSVSTERLKSVSVSPEKSNIATGTVQTPALTVSPGFHGSAMETPITYLDDTSHNFGLSDTHQLITSAETENFGLSDAHQSINSAEMEELCFLEADTNTPASRFYFHVFFNLVIMCRAILILIYCGVTCSQGTSEGINLFARTRAVAQYLKRHSPITPIMEEAVEVLNLNKLLEGKTRKLSARMFFEVLVLKNHGLVDVEQEQPYCDIKLKLTPSLSKAHI
ncbi:hypothetical protein RIF29_31281 [Crotalaria pallida]|uniref:Sister chromatid cohesion 1 protein 3 n=1 Tax=Crotalaria pallida TaxID=3830 RepID=A0AAN9EJ79_CROPI